MIVAAHDPGIDPLTESLEEFYGVTSLHVLRVTSTVTAVCGVTRVPGGRVRCMLLNHHTPVNRHRGHDSLGRAIYWQTGT